MLIAIMNSNTRRSFESLYRFSDMHAHLTPKESFQKRPVDYARGQNLAGCSGFGFLKSGSNEFSPAARWCKIFSASFKIADRSIDCLLAMPKWAGFRRC